MEDENIPEGTWWCCVEEDRGKIPPRNCHPTEQQAPVKTARLAQCYPKQGNQRHHFPVLLNYPALSPATAGRPPAEFCQVLSSLVVQLQIQACVPVKASHRVLTGNKVQEPLSCGYNVKHILLGLASGIFGTTLKHPPHSPSGAHDVFVRVPAE